MRVGFIGLGTMGTHFASNLQKSGFDLVVHDLSRQATEEHVRAGAMWVESPKAVAKHSDIIMASLPGPPEVEAVFLDNDKGLIAAAREDHVIFDLSTNSPTVIRDIYAKFAERGAHVLDAPVSGGPKGAKSGKLAIWVGGNEKVFEKNRTYLDAIGDQVKYIGKIGAGAIAKLVHNSAGYAIQCAISEVFTAGVKAGVEPLALWEAIRQGARGRVRTFDSLGDHFLINHYDPPNFALQLAHKDISLACELGRDMEVPMRLINLTQQEMREALNRDWGHRDSRSFLLLQQERAGLQIEEKREDVAAILASG
ncbi:MAG: 3-hydroxyisobutyrate dehydrogenase [Rhodospirillaceae bacterium]|nr:3-hydroxyisobutyrate dehydrogenase [Rhodospirillaceae bacterium]